jgi:predicted alpha/beta-hydrolase family hydrolase
LLGTDRPTLVVQGGADPFGRPEQFPKLPPDMELVVIPSANHMFSVGAASGDDAALARLTGAVIEWLERLLHPVAPVG